MVQCSHDIVPSILFTIAPSIYFFCTITFPSIGRCMLRVLFLLVLLLVVVWCKGHDYQHECPKQPVCMCVSPVGESSGMT